MFAGCASHTKQVRSVASIGIKGHLEKTYNLSIERRNIDDGSHPCDSDSKQFSRFLSVFSTRISEIGRTGNEKIFIEVEPENCGSFTSYLTGGAVRLGLSSFSEDSRMRSFTRVYAGHKSAKATVSLIKSIDDVIEEIRSLEESFQLKYGIAVKHDSGLASVKSPNQYLQFLKDFIEAADEISLSGYRNNIDTKLSVRLENWNPFDSNLVGPDVYPRSNEIIVGHRSAQKLLKVLLESKYFVKK